MIVVNLEKYNDDGFKQSANSLTASSPDNVTHARLYYDSFAGSDYIQGTFVSGNNSTVEFDASEITFTQFKLFTSTDGVTYTERKTFGGSDGLDIFNNSMALDPADADDNQIPVKDTIDTVEQVVWKDITDVLDDVGYASSVNYILRGMLCQDNSVQSGKAFFGTYYVNPDDGTLIDGTSSTLTGSRVITIADRCLRSASAKISTGIYSVQCQISNGSGGFTNGFISGIDGTANIKTFIPFIQPVFGSWTSGLAVTFSYTVSEIQRFSSTHVRIKLTGISDHTALTQISTQIYIQDLVSDLLPVPAGYYTISSKATTYIDILCNTDSGNGSFTAATGLVGSVETDTYGDVYQDELKGYLILDTNHEPLTYYGTGKLIFKTVDTNYVLTDGIINRGIMIDIKFPILA